MVDHRVSEWAWPQTDDASEVRAGDPHALLVTQMADGNQGAAAALHDAFFAHLMRIAYRIVRERADAEEVVSDTFAKAWRDSASFDGARGSVTGWLTMMARSRARDLVRVRARRDRAHDRAEAHAAVDSIPVSIGWSTAWDITGRLETEERELALSLALLTLPDKQREAIALVFLQNTSHTIAADQLGVPLGTVKTRVRLGLRRMRTELERAGVTRIDADPGVWQLRAS